MPRTHQPQSRKCTAAPPSVCQTIVALTSAHGEFNCCDIIMRKYQRRNAALVSGSTIAIARAAVFTVRLARITTV